MTSDLPDESVSPVEQDKMLFAAIAVPLARMIYSGAINPETITKDQLKESLKALGVTHEDAFEIYITEVEEETALVAHCLSEGRVKSAIVILFTLMEHEVNALVGVNLQIRGYSPGAIAGALKGVNFDSKLNVLLPLLEITVPDRFRNAALQCKSIRNVIVHSKAMPALMADIGNKLSDGEVADERSARFFLDNPLSRVRSDLEELIDAGVSADPAMQWSRQLFDKYLRVAKGGSGA